MEKSCPGSYKQMHAIIRDFERLLFPYLRVRFNTRAMGTGAINKEVYHKLYGEIPLTNGNDLYRFQEYYMQCIVANVKFESTRIAQV